jgi:hypothetical protein
MMNKQMLALTLATNCEPIYIRLDCIATVGENHYTKGKEDTVVSLKNGHVYHVVEPPALILENFIVIE